MPDIISVEEARELLGDEANNMSDEQIRDLIEDLHIIARYSLKMAREEVAKENAEKKAKNDRPK